MHFLTREHSNDQLKQLKPVLNHGLMASKELELKRVEILVKNRNIVLSLICQLDFDKIRLFSLAFALYLIMFINYFFDCGIVSGLSNYS